MQQGQLFLPVITSVPDHGIFPQETFQKEAVYYSLHHIIPGNWHMTRVPVNVYLTAKSNLRDMYVSIH